MDFKFITVTRALVELKKIDDKINRAISSGKFIARVQGKGQDQKVVDSRDTIAEASAKIQGSFDKVDALIKNRAIIKGALVKSNAETSVRIMDRTLSVAEAIELKNTVEFRKTFLSTLRQQLHTARLAIDKNNAALESQIQSNVTTLLGSDKTVDPKLLDSIRETNQNKKLEDLLDPSKIEDQIARVEKEISDLTSELDFVLSESNAKTTIMIDFNLDT